MVDLVQAPATLPPGQRIYAVGDVHGCLDRLVAMHEAIAEDLAARPTEETVLIHLGDLVDRGPESAQVVEWLLAGPPMPAQRFVNLMGNHEEMMLAAVATSEEDAADLWMRNGGADSLHSWGVQRAVKQPDWASRIPVSHLLFLRDLELHCRIGPYLFVHAGVRPGVPLRQQTRQDLLWIREPFLSSRLDHGAVVVHGHTPKRDPTVRPNRIGIDTGAVIGGALTCVVLESDRLGFLHT
ncbi:MAG TPA: metallophosphoesterase family protein [Acetobacteraceae bacterium]|jgi:serine/threonine protein phosphatase 1